MPFEIATRGPRPSARCLSRRQVAALYPADPAARYEGPMLAWALAFYASYVLCIAGVLPGWVFVPLGFLFLLRYFNRTHELLHADPRTTTPGHPARVLLILMGPVYLGYRELREMHLTHHRLDGGLRDPDRGIMFGSPGETLLRCLFEPELSAVWYASYYGLRPRTIAAMFARAGAWGLLMALGGWKGFLLYNLTTRLGNTAAWFVFSRVAHTGWLYGQVSPPEIPRPIARLWGMLICDDNLQGIRFHFLHHRFPSVPDRDLPHLSEYLAAMGEGVALSSSVDLGVFRGSRGQLAQAWLQHPGEPPAREA